MHDCHSKGFEITPGGRYKQISTQQLTKNQIEKKINEALSPIPTDQIFLGQVAKEAGYRTAQIGKLEWGFSTTDKQMKRHGWDYYYGYLDHVRAHGFYPPFLFENGNLIPIEGNTLANCGKSGEPETIENSVERNNKEGKLKYSQNLFMNKAFEFIEKNKNEPFFLYFPTQLPHGPVAIPEVHPDFVNDNRLTPIEKEYASMVKMLDDNVGQLMLKVKQLGIDDNTIIIFTADNGHEIYYAQEGRITKPYSNIATGKLFNNTTHKYYSHLSGDVFDGNGGRAGLKRSNLQGGIQVPFIVRWPSKLKKGTVNHKLIANYDLLPTLAEITGFTGKITVDGESFYDDLVGMKNKEEYRSVVYSSYTGPALITSNGWKIRIDLKENVTELFYLPDDFKEENDIGDQHPQKLQKLKKQLLKACENNLYNGLFTNQGSVMKLSAE